jgi:hypothetical protein
MRAGLLPWNKAGSGGCLGPLTQKYGEQQDGQGTGVLMSHAEVWYAVSLVRHPEKNKV